ASERSDEAAVTLQCKLLLGFSLMVLPTLLFGVEAIRTNALERGTLETLRQRLAHSRTYAEVEDAMFNQTQVVWRYLSGDPTAKKEFPLTQQVVDRSEEHTSELQSRVDLVCRLLLEKKKV